jgi:DNA replication factor GINS
MYDELYAAWRREVDEASLGSLPPDFYVRIADYLKRIKEENRQPDKKSVKASLLDHEAKNVALMLEQLLWARYKKLLETVSQNQKLPFESLTVEEAKMSENFAAFTSAYQKFTVDLLQGQTSQTAAQTGAEAEVEVGHKRVTLRFTKNIPAIIGVDMKSYGPFQVEDVASLPVENAKVLVKQGLAVLVEVS